MTFSAVSSTLYTKMSRRRGKSPGWAAFDLKQQQKQVLGIEADNEPYPPISSTIAPLLPCQNFVKNDDLPVKSFSSVLLPFANFPTLTANKDIEKKVKVANYSVDQSNKLVEGSSAVQACEKLKVLHHWADENLIEDIMAAVQNDIDKASALLQSMVSSRSIEENEKTNITESKSNPEDFLIYNKSYLGETTDLAELSGVLGDHLNHENKELMDDRISVGKVLTDEDDERMKLVLGDLRLMPVEPEWEEDDIYLIHRKDAMRMMRSASRHSKAASDAYVRGDHFSAQQFSLKAREEWISAESLTAKAAKEILSIRNCKNDVWKLDLHGLHAAEAVQALQEHLWKIESRVPLYRSVSPNIVNTEPGIIRCASLESLSNMDKGKLDKHQASSKQRPTSLQVITGRGNHSRGGAALPAAVRSFLSENRYQFDEARPGVITVRPKFRRQ